MLIARFFACLVILGIVAFGLFQFIDAGSPRGLLIFVAGLVGAVMIWLSQSEEPSPWERR